MELDPNDGRLIFQRAPWSDDYEFMLAYKAGDGAVVAQPIVWERIEKFQAAKAATFEILSMPLQIRRYLLMRCQMTVPRFGAPDCPGSP